MNSIRLVRSTLLGDQTESVPAVYVEGFRSRDLVNSLVGSTSSDKVGMQILGVKRRLRCRGQPQRRVLEQFSFSILLKKTTASYVRELYRGPARAAMVVIF